MFLQLIINALVASSWYVLIGIGASLILRTCRFFDISLGALFTVCPYFAFLLKEWFGFPLVLSIVLAIPSTMLLEVIIYTSMYSFLFRAKASPLIILLVSLGLYIILQNLVSLIFGDDTKIIRPIEVQEGLSIFSAKISSIQGVSILIAIFLITLTIVLIRKSKIGKALRAVAIDPELAAVSGIEVDLVRLWSMVIACGLAGAAGILMALDIDMTPTMGLDALVMGLVAAIIGGPEKVIGVTLGALFLAIVQHIGLWELGPKWHEAGAFVILLLFLLFRPEGLIGRKVKKATV